MIHMKGKYGYYYCDTRWANNNSDTASPSWASVNCQRCGEKVVEVLGKMEAGPERDALADELFGVKIVKGLGLDLYDCLTGELARRLVGAMGYVTNAIGMRDRKEQIDLLERAKSEITAVQEALECGPVAWLPLESK